MKRENRPLRLPFWFAFRFHRAKLGKQAGFGADPPLKSAAEPGRKSGLVRSLWEKRTKKSVRRACLPEHVGYTTEALLFGEYQCRPVFVVPEVDVRAVVE